MEIIIFKKKTDAYKCLLDTLEKKVEDGDLYDRLMISYARFTEWLPREYAKATGWQQDSLHAAVEPWFCDSWRSYAEYVQYSERTCQRYAVKGQDYQVFCGRMVSCQGSADRFRYELDHGLRGNRPR
jgi:hypothetical protein